MTLFDFLQVLSAMTRSRRWADHGHSVALPLCQGRLE
jgi:hypothetical protein